MEIFLIALIIGLNVLISWWNAKVCGSIWDEAKALGGWMRLLVWCGAIQSAVGFSMLIMVGLILLVSATGYLPPEAIKAMANLWYVTVIVPALGTGIIITVHSWIEFFREKSLVNGGVMVWNTLATIHNVYEASQSLGPALSSLGSFFSEAFDSSDNAYWRAGVIVIGLVLIALLGGALITATLIKKYAGTRPLPVTVQKMANQR